MDLEFYPNTEDPKPVHGTQGTYRRFFGVWEGTIYSGDRMGNDIYCAHCDTWSTVKGTNILFSIVGKCKKCNTSFADK